MPWSKWSIVDELGADDWSEVVVEFGHDSISGIQEKLDDIFPDDVSGHHELAEAIARELDA